MRVRGRVRGRVTLLHDIVERRLHHLVRVRVRVRLRLRVRILSQP